MTKSLLHDYVHLLIEQMKMKEADITGGSTVPWGSPEHILDLEGRIESLNIWRNKQPRGSAARANYARLIDQLRSELRSATKFSQKNALLPLSESRYNHLVLNEEIVTIKRKGQQPSLYDVTFNSEGDIVAYYQAGKKQVEVKAGSVSAGHTLSDWQATQLAYMKRHTRLKKIFKNTDEFDVVDFLETLESAGDQGKLFATPSDPAQMQGVLNSLLTDNLWKKTLDWGVDSNTGRGEMTVHLAFASKTTKEPDWAGGGFGLSIKNASGTESVRSGEGDADVSRYIGEMLDALKADADSKISLPIYPVQLEKAIADLQAKVDPTTFSEKYYKCVDAFNSLRYAVAKEHDTSGIMFLTNDKFDFFPATSAVGEDITSGMKMYAIASENRVRFFHYGNTSSLTLNDVLSQTPSEFKRSLKTKDEKISEKASEFEDRGVKEPEKLVKALRVDERRKIIHSVLNDGRMVLFRTPKSREYVAYILDSNEEWRFDEGPFDIEGNELIPRATSPF